MLWDSLHVGLAHCKACITTQNKQKKMHAIYALRGIETHNLSVQAVEVITLLRLYGHYVGVLISLWLFLFAAQLKEFVFDGLKKSEQRSHKCVELGGEHVE
jgi:alkyl sulfatase BDS1-like metallo-beta-lactamase superfamily hydrolase